jgi:hypothetical protein
LHYSERWQREQSYKGRPTLWSKLLKLYYFCFLKTKK